MAASYFVYGPGGQKTGPYALDTLQGWAAAGQLPPDAPVEDAETGQRLRAGEIPGLSFARVEAPKRRSGPLILVLVFASLGVCLLLSVIGAAVLFPVFAQAQIAAKQSASRSNFKMVATGILIYAADHDERLPPEMGSLEAAFPYFEDYTQGTLEEMLSLNPVDSTVLGNARLAGVDLRDLEAPERTLLFYEAAAWQNGRRIVSTTDGAARSLKNAEVEAALQSGFQLDASLPLVVE